MIFSKWTKWFIDSNRIEIEMDCEFQFVLSVIHIFGRHVRCWNRLFSSVQLKLYLTCVIQERFKSIYQEELFNRVKKWLNLYAEYFMFTLRISQKTFKAKTHIKKSVGPCRDAFLGNISVLYMIPTTGTTNAVLRITSRV